MMRRLWKLHSWLGLIAGLGLLIIGLSGSLLVFREELDLLVTPHLLRVQPLAAGRLPLDTLLASANAALPGYEVVGWQPRRENWLADLIYVTPHGGTDSRVATIDPYTGRLIGGPMELSQALSGWLLDLHYKFFSGHVGVLVAGVFAAMLCLLGLSGFWLHRRFWAHFFRLRWRRSARIFFSDLHKMLGISSVVFNLILGFTGAYWNLTDVYGEVTGAELKEVPITGRLYASTLSLDAIVALAGEKLPGFHAGFISLPSLAGGDVTLWGKVVPGSVLRSEFGSSVGFDAQTGAFKELSDVRTSGWWAQTVDAFAPLHYGSFGGLPIKILWSLGGLTPGVLAVSGFLIWRSRHARGPLR